jgi:hypothetical protein
VLAQQAKKIFGGDDHDLVVVMELQQISVAAAEIVGSSRYCSGEYDVVFRIADDAERRQVSGEHCGMTEAGYVFGDSGIGVAIALAKVLAGEEYVFGF